MNEPEIEIKRWTAKRKTQVILDILKGKTTVAEVALAAILGQLTMAECSAEQIIVFLKEADVAKLSQGG